MKKFFLIMLVLLVPITFVYSITPSFYMKGGYLYTYDTNVYSNPLVRHASPEWLEWRKENPYLNRWNNGLHIDSSLFFSPTSRVGVNVSVDAGWPYKAKSYVPDGDYWGKWEYVEYDSFPEQKARVFFGFGPSFRVIFDDVEIGFNVRLSLGAYDFSRVNLVLGVSAEPYLNYFVTNNIFMAVGLHYDAHLMDFYLNDPDRIYNRNYSMITGGAYIGLGFFLGNRGA